MESPFEDGAALETHIRDQVFDRFVTWIPTWKFSFCTSLGLNKIYRVIFRGLHSTTLVPKVFPKYNPS